MRVLMIGAGGVGGYFAGRLSQAKVDLTVVARGEHGRALKERGLRLEGSPNLETISFNRVFPSAAAVEPAFDVVFLAVKWPALDDACAELQRLLDPHGVVIPLLNGLESEEVVASYVGAQRTLSGVAYMSSGLLGPGRIYAHGNTRAGLAPFRPGQDADVAKVAQLLERAGIPVRVQADFRSMLWEKMLWNAPFNAVCALTGQPAGAVLGPCEDVVRAAMQEVVAVARADGADLNPAAIEAMLQVTRADFPRTEPSMLQDVRAGRATEVEILQGAVVRRGEELAVAVPVLRTLASLVRGRTLGA
ncbi:MAG: ketopantoate reductase family protein [Myxococcales bacterium]